MNNYLELLQDVLDNGIQKEDRTGTGTISVFDRNLKWDLREAFPAVTTKKLWMPGIKHELIWFLGNHLKLDEYKKDNRTNIRYLTDNKVNIWNEWADEDGNLGPVYGQQWRDWEGIDQIQNLINNLKTDPDSRRHLVSAWNVDQLNSMKLVPCHYGFQCYSEVIDGERYLSLKFTQRSVDVGLGLPFNIASYGVLLTMLAQCTGHKVKELSCALGDVHIYSNHIEQVKEQLTRETKEPCQLWINPDITDINKFQSGDIKLVDYKSWPTIKMPIAI
tara:strand:- start:6654 stop:7478 length:825 start_codon:yes stop_codon:yes gene_type:complete